jgi:hypothetical protein
LTEAMRVAQMAQDRGKLVVPHCWKTGIGAAATAHFAAAASSCRYIEFLPPFVAESALRRELVQEELQIADGKLDLPRRPGLGVELNPAAMRRFAKGAKEYVEARQGFSVSRTSLIAGAPCIRVTLRRSEGRCGAVLTADDAHVGLGSHVMAERTGGEARTRRPPTAVPRARSDGEAAVGRQRMAGNVRCVIGYQKHGHASDFFRLSSARQGYFALPVPRLAYSVVARPRRSQSTWAWMHPGAMAFALSNGADSTAMIL